MLTNNSTHFMFAAQKTSEDKVSAAPPDIPQKPESRRRNKLFDSLLVVAFFSLVGAISHIHILTNPLRLLTGYSDSYLMLWNFWWVRQSLFEEYVNPFFSDHILIHTKYPVSLFFHTYVFFWGLFSVPFQYLLKNPYGLILAFNIIQVMFIVVSGIGAYYLTGLFCRSRSVRLIISLIPAFYILTRVHSYQVQYGFTGLIPFQMALLFTSLRDEPKNFKYGVGLIAIQSYFDLTYALYMALFSVFAFFFFLIAKKKFPLPGKSFFAGAIASFIIALPILIAVSKIDFQSVNAWQFDRRKTAVSATDPVGLFVPDPIEIFQENKPLLLSFTDEYVQHFDYTRPYVREKRAWERPPRPFETVFLGFIPILLVAVGMFQKNGREKRFWGFAAALFLLLAMGPRLLLAGKVHPNIILPFAFLHYFPPLSMARNPSFYMVPAIYCSLYFCAGGAETIINRFRNFKKLAITTLFLLVILDQFKMARQGSVAAIPSYCEYLAAQQGEFAVLDLPLYGLMENEHYMYYQTLHEKKIFGGFVSRYVTTRSQRDNPPVHIKDDPREIIQYLHSHPELKIRYVILHKHFLRNEFDAVLSQMKNFGRSTYEDEYAVVLEIENLL